MTAEAEMQKQAATPPTPEPKQQAQAKLVNRLMQVLTTATSMTAIEVLGALDVVRFQVAMRALSQPPMPPLTLGKPSLIVKPSLNGGVQ